MINIIENIEIVLILKLNVIFEINNKISREVENNFISSLISLDLSIINKILIRIFKYFLIYSANKYN